MHKFLYAYIVIDDIIFSWQGVVDGIQTLNKDAYVRLPLVPCLCYMM